jgi:dihydrofolate synthase/folylpolyglutamate synthase
LLVLDAAHNPAAAAALARALQSLTAKRRVTLLFGLMADKDAAAMAAALFPLAAQLVLCRPLTRRALPPRRLLALRPDRSLPTQVISAPQAAFAAARGLTLPGGLLLITGSFYLLGDLSHLTGRYPRLTANLK